MRAHARVGLIDMVLNFTPGFAVGLLLGWGVVPAIVLGGVTYVSSSGIVARTLSDHAWTGNRETPMVLSILVIEDLVMALYLPVVGSLLVGGGDLSSLLPAFVGVALVGLVLVLATRLRRWSQQVGVQPLR